MTTTAPTRTRADIEREIASKRRERELYVSPQGVAKCHADLDRLLEEWEATWPADEKQPRATSRPPSG